MNIPLQTQSFELKQALTGKVSLITGSTSGIGLGIARALASAGSDIVLNGFGKPEQVADLQQEIAADYRVRVTYSAADMSKPDAIQKMIEHTLCSSGRLDILVNNAGIQHVAALQNFPPEMGRHSRHQSLVGLSYGTACAPCHARQQVGANHQHRFGPWLGGLSYKSAYVAAKHGIVGLTKVIALETAEQGITCNAICPGYVYTPLVEAQIDGQAKAHGIAREQVIRDVLLAQQPNKRFATVEELGALTAFLASDAAASITGTALPVDGGWTAH